MGRPGTNAPPVRSRLVRASVVAAAAVAVASLAHSELTASSRWSASQTPEPGIVLAAKVASSSTPTAILIRVTAPAGQLPGVVYTVTRFTRGGTTTICTGRAPLRCTDPVGTPGTAVSYTVSSTLAGLGSATTSVDVATAPRPDHAVAARRTLRDRDDVGPAETAGTTTVERAQAAAAGPVLRATTAIAAATSTEPGATSSAPSSASTSEAGPMPTDAPVSQSAAVPTAAVTTTGHVPSATHTVAAPTSTDDASPAPAAATAPRTTSAP